MNKQAITPEIKQFTLYTKLLNGTATLAAFIIVALIIMQPERAVDPDWVIWFLIVIGGLHTFEEYTYPGGFVRWFNEGYFKSQNIDSPLSAKKAFFTDAMAGIVIMALLAAIGPNLLWLTLGIVCIFFINGCWHLTTTITSGLYSPGAVSSALFNLPLGAYIIYFYFSQGYATLVDLLIAYGIGLLVHILFFDAMRREIKDPPQSFLAGSNNTLT